MAGARGGGAKVYRLKAHRERLKAEKAQATRQAVLALDVPEPVRDDLLATIEEWSPSQAGFTFVQLSPEQNAAVVRWLKDNSAQPMLALVLWAECFRYQRRGTNEIRASRQELAEAVGTSADEVSRIMSELVSIGAIIRSYEGRRAVYRMNDRVSTKLAGKLRDRVQAESPQLTFAPKPKRVRSVTPKRNRSQSHLSVVPPPAE